MAIRARVDGVAGSIQSLQRERATLRWMCRKRSFATGVARAPSAQRRRTRARDRARHCQGVLRLLLQLLHRRGEPRDREGQPAIPLLALASPRRPGPCHRVTRRREPTRSRGW